jgi:phosphatidylglycerophosphate synthase
VLSRLYNALYRGLRAVFRVAARPLARRVNANEVSIARGLLSIPVVWLLLAGRAVPGGIALYVLSWTLDLLDGAIAEERRRIGLAADPDLGEVVDTLADKAFLLPILLALLLAGNYLTSTRLAARLLGATVGLTVASEIYLAARRLRDFIARAPAYPPFPPGKIKVWMQAIGTGCLILAFPLSGGGAALSGLGLLVLSLPLAAWSIAAKQRATRRRRESGEGRGELE